MPLRSRRLFAFSLVFLLTPGLVEATENLWHLARQGHSAHAPVEGSDHRPSDDEHGCTSTFHVCSCHHSSPTMLPLATAHLTLCAVSHSQVPLALHPEILDLPGPFRPPRA